MKKGYIILIMFLGLFLCTKVDAATVVESGTCGNNLTYTLDDEGLLTISGSGAMDNYYPYWPDIPWYGKNIKKVKVEEGVSSIGSDAFCECHEMEFISLPSTLKYIYHFAFVNCYNLKGISLPKGFIRLGDYAFMNCEGLQYINVDNENISYSSVDGILFNKDQTEIERFPCAKEMDEYIIPSTVKTINTEAFSSCKHLSNVVIPNSVTSIGDDAFSCCSMKTVELPNSIKQIGEGAFWGNDFTEVIIPEGVETIGSGAFGRGNEIRTVVIPRSVKSIGNSAFTGCIPRVLPNVHYAGSVDEWNSIENVYEAFDEGTLYFFDYKGYLENEDCGPGGKFVFNDDAFPFSQSDIIVDGYYIKSKDYKNLTKNLTKSEKESILYTRGILGFGKKNLFNVDGKTDKHTKWSGSCYGIAVTSFLVNENKLAISDIGPKAFRILHDVQYTTDSISAINFYYAQQFLSPIQKTAKAFQKKTILERLNAIEEMVADGKPAVLCFNWKEYKKEFLNPWGIDESYYGHAVLAYGVENGNWSIECNGIKKTYTKRLLIYDSNNSYGKLDTDLYYTNTGYWCIPEYNAIGNPEDTASYKNKYSGTISFASNDATLLNTIDFHTGDYYKESRSNNTLYTGIDNKFNVSWDSDYSYDIDGFSVEATGAKQGEKPSVMMQCADSENADKHLSQVILPDGIKEYRVVSKNDDLDFAIVGDDYFSAVESDCSGTVVFSEDGDVKAELDKAASCTVEITTDNQKYCDTISFSNSDIQNIEIVNNEGTFLISSDNLQECQITIEKEGKPVSTLNIYTSASSIEVMPTDDTTIVSPVYSDNNGYNKTEINKNDIIITTKDIKVSGISLSGLSHKIVAGKKMKLTASAKPNNATKKSLKWSSSNPKIATVTQNGLVTIGKKATPGKTVTIKAKATDGSGVSADFKIKIMKGAVKKITVKGYKKTLKVGKTMNLKAVVKVTKGKPVNKKMKWKSSNPKWATVTPSGKVRALRAGKGKTVKITVMSTDGTNKKVVKKIKIK